MSRKLDKALKQFISGFCVCLFLSALFTTVTFQGTLVIILISILFAIHTYLEG